MSLTSKQVVVALRDRVAAALAEAGMPMPVGITAPIKVAPTTDQLCYLVSLTPADRVHAFGVIERVHSVQLRLWVRSPDDSGEERFLDLADAIGDGFFAHRSLGIGAHNAEATAIPSSPFVNFNNTTYRQRLWLVAVTERFQTTFA